METLRNCGDRVFSRATERSAMRPGLLLSLTILLALAVAPAATALKPAREFVAPPGDIVITDQCAFPVLGHIEGGEIDTTFFDRTGNPAKQIAVFPGQTLTLTNLDTRASITVINAGSSQVRAEGDGSLKISIMGHGPLPNEIIGEPGLWYLSGGQVIVKLDGDGNPTSVTIRGNVANLCDQLAPAPS
jgi:hypothetical protein